MSDTYSALQEYRKRIAAMLADPECTDDLFSLGVALLDFAVLRSSRHEKTFAYYADQVWGPRHGWRVRAVLRSDVRRYDAVKDETGTEPARRCGAPMVRRDGPCGQSGSLRAMLTDPETGRKQWLSACARHREWFEARIRSNRAQVEVANPERPPANAGGVLARHIPEIDWPKVWVDIDPNWTAPPEAAPEEVPLRPRLRLVVGGSE